MEMVSAYDLRHDIDKEKEQKVKYKKLVTQIGNELMRYADFTTMVNRRNDKEINERIQEAASNHERSISIFHTVLGIECTYNSLFYPNYGAVKGKDKKFLKVYLKKVLQEMDIQDKRLWIKRGRLPFQVLINEDLLDYLNDLFLQHCKCNLRKLGYDVDYFRNFMIKVAW